MVSGSVQQMVVDPAVLAPGSRVYVAMKVSDEAPNESGLSNVSSVQLPDDVAVVVKRIEALFAP